MTLTLFLASTNSLLSNSNHSNTNSNHSNRISNTLITLGEGILENVSNYNSRLSDRPVTQVQDGKFT